MPRLEIMSNELVSQIHAGDATGGGRGPVTALAGVTTFSDVIQSAAVATLLQTLKIRDLQNLMLLKKHRRLDKDRIKQAVVKLIYPNLSYSPQADIVLGSMTRQKFYIEKYITQLERARDRHRRMTDPNRITLNHILYCDTLNLLLPHLTIRDITNLRCVQKYPKEDGETRELEFLGYIHPSLSSIKTKGEIIRDLMEIPEIPIQQWRNALEEQERVCVRKGPVTIAQVIQSTVESFRDCKGCDMSAHWIEENPCEELERITYYGRTPNLLCMKRIGFFASKRARQLTCRKLDIMMSEFEAKETTKLEESISRPVHSRRLESRFWRWTKEMKEEHIHWERQITKNHIIERLAPHKILKELAQTSFCLQLIHIENLPTEVIWNRMSVPQEDKCKLQLRISISEEDIQRIEAKYDQECLRAMIARNEAMDHVWPD
jgi:hypothetical protein